MRFVVSLALRSFTTFLAPKLQATIDTYDSSLACVFLVARESILYKVLHRHERGVTPSSPKIATHWLLFSLMNSSFFGEVCPGEDGVTTKWFDLSSGKTFT